MRRVILKVSSTSKCGEYFRRCEVLPEVSSSSRKPHAEGIFEYFFGCIESTRCSSPESIFYMVCDDSRIPYGVALSLRLNRRIRLRVKSILNLLLPFKSIWKTSHLWHIPQPRALNQNPKSSGKKDLTNRGMGCIKVSRIWIDGKNRQNWIRNSKPLFSGDYPKKKWLNK